MSCKVIAFLLFLKNDCYVIVMDLKIGNEAIKSQPIHSVITIDYILNKLCSRIIRDPKSLKIF